MLLIGAMSAALACVLTALWWPLARRLELVAVPDARRRHARPTVCVGAGVCIGAVLAGAFADVPQMAWIGTGAMAVVTLGALDDRFRLGAGVKLAGQVTAAAIPVLGGGVGPAGVSLPMLGAVDLGAARAFIWIGAVVICMNVVNLIDGHDGLAAGLVAIGSFLIVILAALDGRPEDGTLALCVGVAAACFLIVNVPPARVFLGDQGSLGLGYLLAVAALCATAKTGALLGLGGGALAVVIPTADAVAVAAYRMMRRRAPWRADRTHMHHRLANGGSGPWAILARAWGSACLWGALAVGLHVWAPQHRWGVIAGACAVVAAAAVSLHLLRPFHLRTRLPLLRREGISAR